MAGDDGTVGRKHGRQAVPSGYRSGDWDRPLLAFVQPLPHPPQDVRIASELGTAVTGLTDKVGGLQESQDQLAATVTELRAELSAAREDLRGLQHSLEPSEAWWSGLVSPVVLIAAFLLVFVLGPMLPLQIGPGSGAAGPTLTSPIATPSAKLSATQAVIAQFPPTPTVVPRHISRSPGPRAKRGKPHGKHR